MTPHDTCSNTKHANFYSHHTLLPNVQAVLSLVVLIIKYFSAFQKSELYNINNLF